MLILNENKIRQHGKITDNIPLYLLPAIDSTNTFLLNKIPDSPPAFCLAETQTAGRGQQGRTWISPTAKNIYLSYLNYSHTPLNQLQDLSLKVGEHLLAYLHQQLKISDLRLKWPNDILWQEQKLSGILVETKRHQDLSAIVIGIGLNVNMVTARETISQAWTSLSKITGKIYDLNTIAGGLISTLARHFPPINLDSSNPVVL